MPPTPRTKKIKQNDKVKTIVKTAIVAKFIKNIDLTYNLNLTEKGEYNCSSKDNSKTTNQNSKGDNEKRKNLHLIVIHEDRHYSGIIKLKT